MINYAFTVNEEIARWVTEVYIKSNPRLGWWIAFTNPTAGPWKKIVAPTKEGINTEIYRFLREGERPDLILVNDEKKTILIVEAKDFCQKIVTQSQMTKSVRVIEEISGVLQNCIHEHWGERSKYKIVPSFLWICQTDVLDENNLVQLSFDNNKAELLFNDLLNIIIVKNKEEALKNIFVYRKEIYQELNFPLD